MNRGRASTVQKARATSRPVGSPSEFDREFVADEFGAPPKEAAARWERARRKPGRPKAGRGAQVISVSVERDLLERSDALADRLGLSRATLIARGLKAVMAAEGEI